MNLLKTPKEIDPSFYFCVLEEKASEITQGYFHGVKNEGMWQHYSGK